jgi:hypothetical protein
VRRIKQKCGTAITERFLSRWANPDNWTEDFKLQAPRQRGGKFV